MTFNRLHLLVVFAITTNVTAQQTPGNEPKELIDLRGSWTKARNQATQPIDRKYTEALNALKLRFTKAGQLTEAIAIEEELNALEKVTSELIQPKPDFVESDDLSWLVGKTFVYGVYAWNIEPDQQVVKLNNGKSAGNYRYTVEADGRIKVSEDQFRIKSKSRAILFKKGDEEGIEIEIEVTK